MSLPCRVEESQNTATILFCVEKKNYYIRARIDKKVEAQYDRLQTWSFRVQLQTEELMLS